MHENQAACAYTWRFIYMPHPPPQHTRTHTNPHTHVHNSFNTDAIKQKVCQYTFSETDVNQRRDKIRRAEMSGFQCVFHSYRTTEPDTFYFTILPEQLC